MDKSSINSKMIFDNYNENIKTFERLPQIRISNLPAIVFASL